MTKSLFTLFVMIIAVFGNGCGLGQQTFHEIKTPAIEDHASKPYDFKKGKYYTFTFSENAAYNFDEILVIKKLLSEKLDVENVWYKGKMSMCVPPGSDIGMTVIVDPVLLVRLEKANSKMEKLGFVLTTEPTMGECAYFVKNYDF